MSKLLSELEKRNPIKPFQSSSAKHSAYLTEAISKDLSYQQDSKPQPEVKRQSQDDS